MQILKRIFNPAAWRQWMVVFLAGLVVLTTTACGSTQAARPVNNTSSAPVNDTSGVANRPQSEGMYPYKDTNRDTRAADAKADRMIREANQRIQQGNDQSVGERAEEVGQAAKQALDNIGQSTQRAADNAADNARGLVNGTADPVRPNS
jgi:hypothetical protein